MTKTATTRKSSFQSARFFFYLIFDVIHAVQFYEGRIVLFPD